MVALRHIFDQDSENNAVKVKLGSDWAPCAGPGGHDDRNLEGSQIEARSDEALCSELDTQGNMF